MSETDKMPELKQVLGAIIFSSAHPLSVREIRKCLSGTAEKYKGITTEFAKVKDKQILASLTELKEDAAKSTFGFVLKEVAGGYRYQSDVTCGKWIRHLLDAGRPRRLSMPGLETLAIIAYRQPATKAEIEAVRGVNVDHMIKSLMELQLVKIVGRSELAGRPFTYGTTHGFLEHFGLKNLKELSSVDPMLLARREKSADIPTKSGKKEPTPDPALEEVEAEDTNGDEDDES